MVIAAEPVALPDFHARAGDRRAAGVDDEAGEQEQLALCDPRLPLDRHEVVVVVGGEVARIERPRGLARRRRAHLRASGERHAREREARNGRRKQPAARRACLREALLVADPWRRNPSGRHAFPLLRHSGFFALKYSNRSIDFTRTSRSSTPRRIFIGTSTPAAPSFHSFS